jgi:Ice-binding-like
MHTATYYLLRNTFLLLLMAALATALTSGTTPVARAATGPARVNLGTAAPFVILAESGIGNNPPSAITGNIGLSPGPESFLSGFSQVLDGSGTFATSSQVSGNIYVSNYDPPTPVNLSTAVSNMEAAYADAAARASADFTNLYGGDLSGRTLAPGLYKWTTDVSMTSDATLAGASDAVWIFQIAGNLTIGPGAKLKLSAGAQADNIFWQVGGSAGVELAAAAHAEGTILSAQAILLQNGASLHGRALTKAGVTLDQNTVVISVPPKRLFLPLVSR